MSITSTTVVDTVGGTITSAVYLNGSTLIDNLIYTASTNFIAFQGSIAAASLSVNDFIALLDFYTVYNQLIVTTYAPSQFVTIPFSSITFIQSDSGTNLNFEFLPGSIPCFYYSCAYPLGNVALSARFLSANLSYAQWLFFLYLSSEFKLAVRNDYNL